MKNNHPPLSSFTDAEKVQAKSVLNHSLSPEMARRTLDLLWVDKSGYPIPIRMMELDHKKFTVSLWLKKYLEGQLQLGSLANEINLSSAGFILFDPVEGIERHPILSEYASIRSIWSSLDTQEQLYVARHVVKDITQVFYKETRCILFDSWELLSK